MADGDGGTHIRRRKSTMSTPRRISRFPGDAGGTGQPAVLAEAPVTSPKRRRFAPSRPAPAPAHVSARPLFGGAMAVTNGSFLSRSPVPRSFLDDSSGGDRKHEGRRWVSLVGEEEESGPFYCRCRWVLWWRPLRRRARRGGLRLIPSPVRARIMELVGRKGRARRRRLTLSQSSPPHSQFTSLARLSLVSAGGGKAPAIFVLFV
jgi:hypothetical protein